VSTMSQPFRQAGIYVCPLFKNGKVWRVTVPRAVARTLGVGKGDLVTFTMGLDGRIMVEKLNVEALKHAHLSNRSTQLDLSAGSAVASRGGARES
jgi:bifunctional DNA-binding transcriptional regulator/antitoxin component of YhaV-PrlF toxin-antitoxin module